MNSGSWSSWQAALPPEARAGGEPDDFPQDPTRQTYYVGHFELQAPAQECAEHIRTFRDVGPGCPVDVVEDKALCEEVWYVITLRPAVPFAHEAIGCIRNFAEGFEIGYRARMRAEKGA